MAQREAIGRVPRALGVLLGLLVAVVVAELTVRGALSMPGVLDRLMRTQPSGVAAELRWTSQWAQWRADNPSFDARYAMPGALFDPELGWRPAPGQLGADEDGLKGPNPPREPGAVVVVLSGDSFAWGSDVQPEESAAAVLEARRGDVDVRNLGVFGYGHDQMWLRLRREVPTLAPDAALLMLVSGDVPRNGWSWFSYARPTVRLSDGTLEVVGSVDDPEAVLARVRWRSRLLDLGSALWQSSFGGKAGLSRSQVEPLTEAILDAWVAEVRSSGAVPVAVILPVRHQVDDSEAQDNHLDLDLDLYRRWCADADFVCVDGVDRFREVLGDEQGRGPAHWSPAGYRAASVVMEEALVRAGVIGAPD